MLRRLLLLVGLALALGGTARATPPARIDLAAVPAWTGWSRPGRMTEIDIRLSADAATRGVIEIVAGRQSVHADLDLEFGRVQRLHIPVSSAAKVEINVATPGGPTERRDIAVSQSEAPLLGLGLATDTRLELEGFHSVVLTADDLPRNVAAYSSFDALVLDAPTLAALDQSQLGALLAHAAGCGRVVVVATDPRVRRLLDGAGGCDGHTLLSAATLAEARERLLYSLAAGMPAAPTLGGIGELARPSHGSWDRVAVALAVSFAAGTLAIVFSSALPVLLVTPAVAALAALALLHAQQPTAELVVWSEAESGAQVARYQAWQRFPGLVRERARVPIPPPFASYAQPCDPNQALRLDFDTASGHATFAGFDTRLFRQVVLCYSGTFPITRALAVETLADGQRMVRNAGRTAWPPGGVLLAEGRAHDLPALGPGASATVAANAGAPPRDAAARAAAARTRPDSVAALWALDLGGVANVPPGSKGWLLVTLPAP